ncbi:hypothetical protein FACS1894110_11240 [Spirochaetia bacterium]|nr:hypothetical protein FACS1894110_11240 [Spirochaetia bacterium]
MKKLIPVFLTLIVTLLMVSCPLTDSDPEPDPVPMDSKAIDFGGAASKTINLSGLAAGKKIYLVTVNTGAYSVSGGSIGGAAPSIYGEFSGSEIGLSDPGSLLDGGAVPPGHHPGAVAFNANPPPITPEMLQNRALSFSASVAPYTVGSTKNFWVESSFGNETFVSKQATLRAQGTHSNIWVIESWGTALTNTTTQAQALAAKFDAIYPLETKVLGYEYGGGGSGGGKDGDDRVQILVYDFYGISGGSGNTAGFYWSKDFYTQAQLNSSGSTYKTNEAEIFYISANYLNTSPDFIYSTLVHEFQHMINFNVKTVQKSKNSEAWYNEMLSMMAEDMISPQIGIGPANWGHPTPSRIDGFLTSYANEGVARWQGTTSDPGDSLESYSYKYAFGAYLVRNYGGAELLKNILANSSVNIPSIVAALQQTTGNMRIDFNYTLERFAEAFIYSNPADGATFNQTVAETIGGTTYTFAGFDIWKGSGNSFYSGWQTGPHIYTLTSHPAMQPYSVFVQSAGDWVTGTKTSVTLNRPAASGVKLYLMTR